MKWDQIKGFKVGRAWTMAELDEHFTAVRGGVALPGKQPGFAVVAALRPVRDPDDPCHVYILDEYESPDPRQLLRQCAVFTQRYNLAWWSGDGFQWVGDSKNTALQAIIREINAERRSPHSSANDARDRLTVYSTRILDMLPSPYPYMVPLIRECLDPKRQQLYLQDSTLAERLSQIETAEDLTELLFGSHPAIEALAFVVANLRDDADRILDELLHPRRQPEPYNPMDWSDEPYDPGNYLRHW